VGVVLEALEHDERAVLPEGDRQPDVVVGVVAQQVEQLHREVGVVRQRPAGLDVAARREAFQADVAAFAQAFDPGLARAPVGERSPADRAFAQLHHAAATQLGRRRPGGWGVPRLSRPKRSGQSW